MKNNTKIAKEFLSKAIANMPDDFALSEARTAMNRALFAIETVENKRNNRTNQQSMQDQWKQQTAQIANQWKMQDGNLHNPFDERRAKIMLQNLDKMIAEETNKLKMLEEKVKAKPIEAPIRKINSNDDQILG